MADILANGVVVLLVVIILTLSIRKQQTEQEIEQSVEISAILARDIASSLVFNDLPSSPPAILHNYECTRPRGPWRSEYERHDCQPWLYPIIEIHADHIREYSSNRKFTKATLLEEDNEFDIFLRTLPAISRQRIRADIYELDLYYLAISIMKENGARPNHWHFIGEYKQVPGAPDVAREFEEGEDELSQNNFTIAGEDGAGAGEEQTQQGNEQGQGQTETEQPPIPDDVSIRDSQRIDELLPPDSDLGRNAEERVQYGNSQENIEGEFGEAEGEQSYSDSLAAALAGAILEERTGQGDAFGSPSSLQIRLPGVGDQRGQQQERTEATVPIQQIIDAINARGEEGGEPIDYHIFMLIYIMEYLNEVNKLGFDRVSLDDILGRIVGGEIDILNHELLPIVIPLRDQMQAAFDRAYTPLTINKEPCFICLSSLSMQLNQPLYEAKLKTIEPDKFFSDADIVNLNLRLYPYPDAGDETEFISGDGILAHPSYIRGNDPGWYPVAVVDPNLSDLVVGYLYSAPDSVSGLLNVEGDVNSLRIAHQRVISTLPFFPLRREIILGVIYGLLSVCLLLFFFYLIGGLRSRRAAQ